MRRLGPALATALLAAIPAAFPFLAHAAGAVEGGAQQPTNWHAIIMFVLFVCLTLGITYWAAKRTKSAAQFYSAGGGITGFQNGIAIAGDYMSAASFLGISGLVYTVRLRRADLFGRLPRRLADRHVPDRRAAAQSRQIHLRRRRLVPSRPDADPHPRRLRLAGHRGVLSDRPDGRRRQADPGPVRPRLLDRGRHRRRPDDHLRHLRRHARHHLGADHQGGAAAHPARPSWRWRCYGSSASARRRCSPRRSRCIRSISPSWSPARSSPIRSRRFRSASR